MKLADLVTEWQEAAARTEESDVHVSPREVYALCATQLASVINDLRALATLGGDSSHSKVRDFAAELFDMIEDDEGEGG